jgi:hypothetical protein
MLYTDKSKEELEAILHIYKDSFQDLFGLFNELQFKQHILDLLEKKKTERFNSVFETMTPQSLHTIIELISRPKAEQKASPNAKGKKSIPSNPIRAKK